MTGLLLSYYYVNKKSIFTYLIITIFLTVIFAFINPLMSSFLSILLLITPATENLKLEKESGWIKYISVLPFSRKTYIRSYFTFYFILAFVGLIISIIVTLLIGHNIMILLISSLLGCAVAFQYTIIFPLTFKLGTSKSNIIILITSFIVVMLFMIFYFTILIIDPSSEVFWKGSSQGLVYSFIYFIISLIILILAYIFTIKIFSKKEL
ncbi:ABC-2 transporter permease [Staphylococcus sp. HKU1]|uniref:ABC-2 transporter permease n=1 Tax=Staphylococcus sp. HKU1 TaxID=3068989 RepID=UPI003AAC89CC